MKIVVLDDDPTGSQTVYGCSLLLQWDVENLRGALKDSSPLFFILSNTRALSEDDAAIRTKEICQLLRKVLELENLSFNDVLIISRGDSTLRGHGTVEPIAIAEEIGPFDATFHVPAFLEGGRTTINGIHFINGIPVHKSDFAKDKIFGYSTSNLALWLEDKSKGYISSGEVKLLSLNILDQAINNCKGMESLITWLSNLHSNTTVIVDAISTRHLSILCQAIRILKGQKRFLFRSAASFIKVLANLPNDKYQTSDLIALRLKDKNMRAKPGLVMVGSHVDLADKQLEVLLENKQCIGLEVPVEKILQAYKTAVDKVKITNLVNDLLSRLEKIITMHKTPVIYTSRGEVQFTSIETRMSFGIFLAEIMAKLAFEVSDKLGYIISKGGITTNLLLSSGFNLSKVDLKGQLMPGLSVVCIPKNSKISSLPIITFPGNLGDETTLLSSWKLMESEIN